jgi:hypothetical protein
MDGIDPQTGFELLRMCIVQDAVHFLRVTPPQLVMDIWKHYDQHVTRCRMSLLLNPNRPPPPNCDPGRLKRANDRAQLPIRHHGNGHTSAHRVAPLGWWASVARSITLDPDLNTHKAGFQHFVDDAQGLVLHRLSGPNSKYAKAVKHLFPIERADNLIDSDFYVEVYNNTPFLKLQKELSHQVHLAAFEDIRSMESVEGAGVTQSDVIHAQTSTFFSRLFTISLADKRNRICRQDFIAMVRFFYRIPQLGRLGKATRRAGDDYDSEECRSDRKACTNNSVLDVTANHANCGCPSATFARHGRHTSIKRVIHRFAVKAGVQSRLEPSTSNILLNQYTPQECRSMFPKNPSAQVKDFAARLRRELAKIRNIPASDERVRLEADINHILEEIDENSTKGLRLDVQIIGRDEEMWVDCTCVHPSCKTRLSKQYKDTRENIGSKGIVAPRCPDMKEDTVDSPGHDTSDSSHSQARAAENTYYTYTAIDTQKHKHNVYSPLMDVAHAQHIDGARRIMPQFMGAVVTTLGEFSKDMIDLQEWLVKQYRYRVDEEGERPDGRTIQELTAAFRQDFRASIILAASVGNARMILTCGRKYCKSFN